MWVIRLGKLLETAPEEVGEPAEPIYGGKFRKYKLSGLDFKDKIIAVLYDNPMRIVPLLRKVNGNSDKQYKLKKFKNTLEYLEKKGIVYKIKKTDKKNTSHNNSNGWNTSKWFLSSDYIVNQHLEQFLEV